MVTKFWCKELLMIKPDPAPYLLAARKPRETRLLASTGHPLYYTNPARFEIDELSGKTLGQQAFELQFSVNSAAITQGTTQLLNVPGLMQCVAENETLYFRFAWDVSWYSLDKKYLVLGWNTVILVSNSIKISLTVNEYTATLLDTTPHWLAWEQPYFDIADFDQNQSKMFSNTLEGFESGDYQTKNGTFHWGFDETTYYLSGTLGMPFNMFQRYDALGEPVVVGEIQDVPGYNQKYWIPYPVYRTARNVWSPWFYNPKKTLRLKSITVYQGRTYYPYSWDRSIAIGTQGVRVYTDGTKAELIGEVQDMGVTPGVAYTINCNNTEVEYVYVESRNYSFVENNENSNLSRIEISADEKVPGDPYPYLSLGQISSPVNWTKVRSIRAVLL